MAKTLSKYNDEDLRRIEKERLEINAAYDNGYSTDSNELEYKSNKSNQTVNNSFNFDNEFRARIDRYGFIHNSKLPPDLTEYETKRNNIERLRETKWQSMFKEWNKHYSPQKQKLSDKLVSRIFKGIPNSTRNLAWFKLLEVQSQIDAQGGIYEKMKDLARKYSFDLRQIDMDINRTFRNNEAFKQRYCPRQKQLYNILAAYSIYNTEIGYCQGMSTLTAFLLMYLSDEESTFWALSQLMSNIKYSMHGFFILDFPKLIRYSDKHEMIIKQFLPKIHKKLLKCNITPLIYTTKWFLQCYIDCLPFSLVLRFWDVYILKGDVAMLAMSYCIFKMHKKTLLQKNFDMDKINDFINHKLPENFQFEDDLVIEKLMICIDRILRFKFENGSIIEAIPQSEMPKIPFGDFKKADKQDIISQLVIKSSENANKYQDRDAVVGKLAQDRLEIEKRKREERKTKKREKRLNEDTNGPIRNISDDSDDSDDANDDYVDSDEDQSNRNSLSNKTGHEDDDKYEKESMLSNLTRQSSSNNNQNSNEKNSQVSLLMNGGKANSKAQLNDVDSLNKKKFATINGVSTTTKELVKNNSSSIKNISVHSSSNSTSTSTSPPSGSQESQAQHNTAISTGTKTNSNERGYNSLRSKSKSSSDNSKFLTENENKPNINMSSQIASISVSSINQRIETTTPVLKSKENNNMESAAQNLSSNKRPSIPTSHSSYVTSIISNPPPISPSSFLSTQSPSRQQNNQHQHVASIKSSANYRSMTPNSKYEYVRSPHGIYTRISVPPDANNFPYSKRSPTSFRLVSDTVYSHLQKQQQQHQNGNGHDTIITSPNHVSKSISSPQSSGVSSIAAAAVTAAAVSSKRTSSLRSIQKHNDFTTNASNLSNNMSVSKYSNSSSFIRTNTPTKQQLQNHSARIASIQQQHELMKNNSAAHLGLIGTSNYSNMSIISQPPKSSTNSSSQLNYLNQYINSMQLVSNSLHQSNESSSPKKIQPNPTAMAKISSDQIEQYDYI